MPKNKLLLAVSVIIVLLIFISYAYKLKRAGKDNIISQEISPVIGDIMITVKTIILFTVESPEKQFAYHLNLRY